MIIFSSLIPLETDYNFKDFIINNVFAIKGQCQPEDQNCIIPPEECNNNIDDDDDGLVDSKDSDCVVEADPRSKQTVSSGDKVTLDATHSKGTNLNFEWERFDNGPQINDWDDSDLTKAKPSFTAPSVNENTELAFDLYVYNENAGDGKDLTITVTPKPTNPQPNELVLEIVVEKDPIYVGDKQTIIITAIDKSSNKNVEDATINGKVTYPNGNTKKFSDNDGEAVYSWTIGSKSGSGKFEVIADGSAAGYETGHGSKNFNIAKGPTKNGGTDGSGTDGSGTDGSGTDGSGTDGSGTDGSGTDGSGTDGSGTDGSGTDGPIDGYTTRIGLIGIIVIAAIIGVYGKHRSSKRHPQSHVEVITRGGIE